MTAGGAFCPQIPAAFTNSPFPIQYYFELRGKDGIGRYPELGERLTRQPYFVVRQA